MGNFKCFPPFVSEREVSLDLEWEIANCYTIFPHATGSILWYTRKINTDKNKLDNRSSHHWFVETMWWIIRLHSQVFNGWTNKIIPLSLCNSLFLMWFRGVWKITFSSMHTVWKFHISAIMCFCCMTTPIISILKLCMTLYKILQPFQSLIQSLVL